MELGSITDSQPCAGICTFGEVRQVVEGYLDFVPEVWGGVEGERELGERGLRGGGLGLEWKIL